MPELTLTYTRQASRRYHAYISATGRPDEEPRPFYFNEDYITSNHAAMHIIPHYIGRKYHQRAIVSAGSLLSLEDADSRQNATTTSSPRRFATIYFSRHYLIA